MSVTGACSACGHEFAIGDPSQPNVPCPRCGESVTDRHVTVGDAGNSPELSQVASVYGEPPLLYRTGRGRRRGAPKLSKEEVRPLYEAAVHRLRKRGKLPTVENTAEELDKDVSTLRRWITRWGWERPADVR